MNDKFRTTKVKVPKKRMSEVLEQHTFNTIKEAQNWSNKLTPVLDNKEDLELFHYAIEQSTKIDGIAFVPFSTCKVLGVDCVASVKTLNDKTEIMFGIMTPKMAKVFNRN